MILQNDYLKVDIAPLGAELKSIISYKGTELLWQGNPLYWSKTSPVLFPIVGGVKNNYFEYKNEKYSLDRHGFARDCFFQEECISKNKLIYTLKSNAETLKRYPFDFVLQITYELLEKQLKCTYTVENTSKETMLFSIGAHPAFDLQGDMTNYELLFSNDTILVCNTLKDGLIAEKVKTIDLDNQKLALKPELFKEDALVLKNLKSNQLILKNKSTSEQFTFSFENFPYFGIWAAKNAPFVCLEPWCGIADSVNHTNILKEKEGINELVPSESFERSWGVTIE